MNRVRVLINFFLGITLLGSLYACSLGATPLTIYVNETGNDSNDCLSEVNACRTLAAAISKATPRSQIMIGTGIYASHVTIDKFLTIHGTGLSTTTLSADSGSPVILVMNNVHFTVDNLEIAYGPVGIEVDGVSINTQVTARRVQIDRTGIGILNAHGSAVTLKDCSIHNNERGIVSWGGKLDVTNNTLIRSNTVRALETSSITFLDHVSIDQNGNPTNYLLDNPAVLSTWTRGDSSQHSGILKIVSSQISDNYGTGLKIQAGRVGISNSQINRNTGDGIYNNSALVIDNSVINGNGYDGILTGNGATDPGVLEMNRTSVIRNGKGVDILSGKASITNSTISENRGVGIDNEGGDTTLAYVTIAYNISYGITTPIDRTRIQSTIVELNGAPNCWPSVAYYFVDDSALTCNDTLTNTTIKLGSLTMDAGTIDIPLLDGSPAINHATGDCPPQDQRGYARPSGGSCDIGAYEFGAGSHLTYSTSVPETPTLPMLEIVTNTPTVQLAAQVIPNVNAYCRKGPGTLYDQVMVLQKETAYYVIGRDSQNTWWQIRTPGSDDCWVGDSNVGKQGPVEQTSIVQGLPLPGTPASFVNSYVCDTKLKTLGVAFNWAAAQGVTGYRIYRNGDLLATVDASQTSYHDDAPVEMDLVYELEAFNAYGVAVRIPTNVPACK